MMNPDVSMRPTILLLREGTDDSQVSGGLQIPLLKHRWTPQAPGARVPTCVSGRADPQNALNR